MKHTDVKEIFSNPALNGQELTVCGWVRTARDSKNMAFLALNDGSTLSHLQIVIDKNAGVALPPEAVKLGAALKVVGTVVANPNNGSAEIEAKEITVLGPSPEDYPLQKKFQKLETLRIPRAFRYGGCHPPLFPGARLCLREHPAHHRVRLRGRRRNVQGDHHRLFRSV